MSEPTEEQLSNCATNIADENREPGEGGSEPVRAHKAPAWEGVPLAHANLVLEGGAMRGQFTAGVLDFFMDQKLFCEYVVGVSAGALCGGNYVAGAPGRSSLINVKYAADNRYLSMQSFVRTGNAYGREFAFHEIPDVLDPFDYEAFRRSPIRFEAVSTTRCATTTMTCPISSRRHRCRS